MDSNYICDYTNINFSASSEGLLQKAFSPEDYGAPLDYQECQP